MVTRPGGGVPSSSITRPVRKMGCGTPAGAVVVVGVELVVVGEGGVVRPVVAPVLPVAGGVVAPPVVWPVTAIGMSRPRAAAVVIALTQIFEAIPTSVDCPHYPTKNCVADVNSVTYTRAHW